MNICEYFVFNNPCIIRYRHTGVIPLTKNSMNLLISTTVVFIVDVLNTITNNKPEAYYEKSKQSSYSSS
jgi:hypothetical protein